MTASYLSGAASTGQDRTQSTSLAGVAVGDWVVIWTGRRSLPELDQTVADPALTDVTIDGSWIKLGEQTSWRDTRSRDLYAAAFTAKVATVGATPSASVTWSAADGSGFVAVLAWRVAGVDKVVGSGLAGVNNTDGPLDLILTAVSGESLGSGDDVVAIGAKDGDSALTEPAEFTTSEQIFSTGNIRAASGTYAGDSSAALTFEGSGGRGLNLMGFAFAEDSAPPPPPPPPAPAPPAPSGRRPITLCELHQKVCGRSYGDGFLLLVTREEVGNSLVEWAASPDSNLVGYEVRWIELGEVPGDGHGFADGSWIALEFEPEWTVAAVAADVTSLEAALAWIYVYRVEYREALTGGVYGPWRGTTSWPLEGSEAPGACRAEIGVTGAQRCFNTRATCQDLDNFDQILKTLRLAEPVEGIPLAWNAVPSLKGVSIKGARINYAGLTGNSSPLGVRGAATVDIQDHPDGDSMTDPYLSTRLYDPVKRGTAWGKWLARHRDWQDLGADILTGDLGLAYPTVPEAFTGWTPIDSTINGPLQFTVNATGGAGIISPLNLVVGQRYQINWDGVTASHDVAIEIRNRDSSAGTGDLVFADIRGTGSVTFVATQPGVYLRRPAAATGTVVKADRLVVTGPGWKRRSFFLEEVKGPSAGGAVSLTVRDILSRADGGRAKIPRATTGELKAGINASQTSFVMNLGPGETILDYFQRAASFGLLRIGREVIRFSVRSDAVPGEIEFSSCIRGMYGTTAAAHDAGEGVQYGPEWQDDKPWRIIRDLLTNFAGVPLAWIPEDEWQAEHERWLLPYDNVGGGIIEPSDLDDVIAEVCEATMTYLWVDPVAQKIRFRAARPVEEEVIDLTDLDDILADSQGRDIRITEQVSRGDVFFGVASYAEKTDDPKNYRNIRSVVGDQFGLPRIRQILSRWLKTDAQATQTARTLLLASNVLPIYATVTVGAKDVERLGPGSIVRLNTRILQDATGATEPALFLVIEAQEAGASKMRLTMRTVGSFPTATAYADDVVDEYSLATTEEREENAFYVDNDGKIDAVAVPYFYV